MITPGQMHKWHCNTNGSRQLEAQPPVGFQRVVSWLRGLLKKRPKIEYVQCPECQGMGLAFNKKLMWQLPCKRCNQTGKIEKPANDRA